MNPAIFTKHPLWGTGGGVTIAVQNNEKFAAKMQYIRRLSDSQTSKQVLPEPKDVAFSMEILKSV